MDAMTTDFGEVLLWSFWFFIWIAALMVWAAPCFPDSFYGVGYAAICRLRYSS